MGSSSLEDFLKRERHCVNGRGWVSFGVFGLGGLVVDGLVWLWWDTKAYLTTVALQDEMLFN